MEMRRPTAILLHRPNARNPFAPRNGLADMQLRQRLLGQVPVEREKFLTLSRAMPENHHWAIIFLGSVVRQGVDNAFQGSVNGAARRNKKIDPQMNGAALVGGTAPCAEKRRIVKQPRLVVSPESDADAS